MPDSSSKTTMPKFHLDMSLELNNSLLLSITEQFVITVKTTAAESPWSNGMLERHNGILAKIIEKLDIGKACECTRIPAHIILKIHVRCAAHLKHCIEYFPTCS